jgi:hypothetical protein
VTALLLVLAFALGCSSRDTGNAVPAVELAAEAESLASAEPPPNNWARAIQPPPPGPRPTPPRTVVAAGLSDALQDSDELVVVRRLVYRVSFLVPPVFRDRRANLGALAGELHVDVSETRLRARFLGPGWPIDEGSEIRLRADLPGVYVFDGLGGRPLPPGDMAAWFEGRPSERSRSNIRIRRDAGAGTPPGELVCALLAEWTRQDREVLLPRCSGGALPPGFRFGPWSAELTAVVPMQLPRRALRADEVDPPHAVPHDTHRAMLADSDLQRITAARRSPGAGGPRPPPGTKAALEIENNADSRIIVLAQGVPIGWLDPGHTGTLEGLSPGTYRVGAVRPFGVLLMAPRPMEWPGQLRIGKKPTL